MESVAKISRQKLVENSRQKFYDNLNKHEKDNQGAMPVEEVKEAVKPKKMPPPKTASSQVRSKPLLATATDS